MSLFLCGKSAFPQSTLHFPSPLCFLQNTRTGLKNSDSYAFLPALMALSHASFPSIAWKYHTSPPACACASFSSWNALLSLFPFPTCISLVNSSSSIRFPTLFPCHIICRGKSCHNCPPPIRFNLRVGHSCSILYSYCRAVITVIYLLLCIYLSDYLINGSLLPIGWALWGHGLSMSCLTLLCPCLAQCLAHSRAQQISVEWNLEPLQSVVICVRDINDICPSHDIT